MFLNHVDKPSSRVLTDIMSKVNALGHEPRVVVELDKFSYIPGLKRKYDVIEYITKETTKNVVSIINSVESYEEVVGGTGTILFDNNYPTMPIEGKDRLEDMVITSRHRSVNASRPKHKGLDLDLAIGDPVVAVWGGSVVEVKYDSDGYGHYVTVDHGNGVRTRYAHLDSTSVEVGHIIQAGTKVGLGGNTGLSIPSGGGDGSHLHFEIWKDGVDMNPEPILAGKVKMNGVTSSSNENKASVTTITKTKEKVTFNADFANKNDSSWSNKFTIGADTNFFTASTPDGAKRMFGWKKMTLEGFAKVEFTHTWFDQGYLDFSFFYDNESSGDILRVEMDGQKVWSALGDVIGDGVYHPAPITVPKGEHTFKFYMKNTNLKSDSSFGLLKLKAAEFYEIEEQTVTPSTSVTTTATSNDPITVTKYRNTTWDYEDSMGDTGKWNIIGNVTNGGDYLKVPSNSTIGRTGGVSYPFTTQFTVKVDPNTSHARIKVGDGNKSYTIKLSDEYAEFGDQGHPVDNLMWQTYMLVAKKDGATLFVQKNGVWVDTKLPITSESGGSNAIQFYLASTDTGALYVDDVKYVGKDFSTTAPTTTVEMKETPKWYELGGFVYDETFYLDDVMEWEVTTHLDMSSSTARVKLDNSHGLYSPEYVKSSIFPDNLTDNPYSYIEQGQARHIISEYTPVRIYAGYGNDIVRVFTGMIKGEIEEDSEQRTITFNCVDRYDLLEECVLLKEMSFPPAEAFNGDKTPRPWIKSSIVQYLANHAGMTGWRYVYEDRLHPDLVIEETYYTDVSRDNNTFMKFDSKGTLEEVTLEAKTPNGYRNPFVESIVFNAGERVSDCIRTIIDEINFRAYVNRYGTFVLHHLDFDNNMRWEFKSGENLFSLNTSTDYSRIRNHLIIVGSNGNKEHYFDKDLIIATKGHIRTAQIDCPWIDESDGVTAAGAKQIVADRLFFDMKRQARTKNVVVKGDPFIEVLDGCYVYDSNTSTSGYYIIKGNTLMGNAEGIVNHLELTWEEKVNY